MFRVIQKKPSRIHRYYRSSGSFGEKRHEIALFLLFIVGLVIGTITIRKSSSALLERLLSLFQDYCIVKSTQSIGVNFCSAVFRHILLLCTVFCTGLCAVGVPFIYLFPLLYGCGVGVIGAYLYKAYALKGIGYCALILYPGRVIMIGALVYACTAAACMSGSLMQTALKKESANSMEMHTYNKKLLLAGAVSAGAALLETALFGIFSRYFQFS